MYVGAASSQLACCLLRACTLRIQCFALPALSALLLHLDCTLFCTVHFMLAFTLPCGITHAGYGIGSAQPRVGRTGEGAIGPIEIAECILSLHLLRWGHALMIA